MGGGVVAFVFLTAFRAADGTHPLYDVVGPMINGRYGVRTVVTGLSSYPTAWEDFGRSDPGTWMLATWFWLAIAITAFLFAAYRQPER
jgi:hypothetical protein